MANYYYCRHLAKTSDLFETTTRGLLLNKGLMLSNRAFCCLKIETIMRIIHYTTLREAGIYILATPPPWGEGNFVQIEKQGMKDMKKGREKGGGKKKKRKHTLKYLYEA